MDNLDVYFCVRDFVTLICNVLRPFPFTNYVSVFLFVKETSRTFLDHDHVKYIN